MAVIIDPRVAELLGHDLHLPPVPPDRLTRAALEARFRLPPAWEPDVEIERWGRSAEPVAAAVLVPLVMRAQEPAILLTQRNAQLKQHAGQISFPGGRAEPSDADAIATALREAHEEIGLEAGRVDVLGTLPTYTTGTGFIVTPVVGLIEPEVHEAQGLTLQADPGEVADIFEVPMHFLMDPRHHQRRAFAGTDSAMAFYAMPWTSLHTEKEYFIWGATAAMLRNLYRFLSA